MEHADQAAPFGLSDEQVEAVLGGGPGALGPDVLAALANAPLELEVLRDLIWERTPHYWVRVLFEDVGRPEQEHPEGLRPGRRIFSPAYELPAPSPEVSPS